MLKTIGWAALVLIITTLIFVLFRLTILAKQSREITPQLGVADGQLTPCPNTPNCVSSQSTLKEKSIKAISGGKSAFEKLAAHISLEPTAIIVNQREDYLHATYQSKRFGFIDDLELYLQEDIIEVRSASRVGISDLGANRKRVEALRVTAGR